MNACIIAVNSAHDRFMGFATCQKNGNMALKSSSSPVVKNKNNLVGITGNEKLLNDIKVSPLIINLDTPTHSVLEVIREWFRNDYSFSPEALILTMNNFIYHWKDGYLHVFAEFDENYLAIGPGSEIAMGALFGLKSSRYSVKEQVEMAIMAVVKYYPELGQSTGVLNI